MENLSKQLVDSLKNKKDNPRHIGMLSAYAPTPLGPSVNPSRVILITL